MSVIHNRIVTDDTILPPMERAGHVCCNETILKRSLFAHAGVTDCRRDGRCRFYW